MTQPLTKDQFDRDVAQHQLMIRLDQGVHRHLTLKAPDTLAYHYHITTWPGHLAMTGDMGSWVFSRLQDMFEFFRQPRINLSYWSEKLQACDCTGRYDGGAMEYSRDLFRAVLWTEALQLCRRAKDDGASINQRAALIEDLKSIRDCSAAEHEYGAHVAVRDFSCWLGGKRYEINDFQEHNLRVYKHRYIWACYAIQHAIAMYDQAKTKLGAAA